MPSGLTMIRAFILLPSLLLSLSDPATADGVSDFASLKAIINNAANSFRTTLNATKSMPPATYPGFGLLNSLKGTVSTADLLGNVTGSILSSKFNLDTNQAAFVNNTSVPLDGPYQDYLDSIPNLSSALIALGRSWHQELNAPVYTAIEALSQSVHGYGSDLLQASLITSNSTIRTIHVASTFSDAQTAWSKILNYPGVGPSSDMSLSSSSSRGPLPGGGQRRRGSKLSATERRGAILRGDSISTRGWVHGLQDLESRSPRRSSEGLARPGDGAVRQAEKVAALRNGVSSPSTKSKPVAVDINAHGEEVDGDIHSALSSERPNTGTASDSPSPRRRQGTVVGRSIVPWA